MVINGKKIAYIGYNTPICYDDDKTVDLGGKAVIPLVNELIHLDYKHAQCSVLAEGERADFAVLDKNILKEPDGVEVLEVYIGGKKKAL
jgi:predicted amidohydrolase YtcJ